jgi:diaminopimelate decarboxylase
MPGFQSVGRSAKSKLGMSREEILHLLPILREEGVTQIGLCTSFAKNQTGPEYYPTVAEHLFRLAAELQSGGQIGISFLDLMGGLGIDYRHGETVTPLDEMAQRIWRLYETIMEPAGLGDVPIYTELGRYLMAPCAILVASVTHVRHSFRDFIALDASAADLIRPMLYSGYHHISVVGKHETAGRRYYDVVGPMNNGSDNFGERRLLPETKPGDLCVIHDTGAHCAGSVFSHAGHFRCAEYLQTQSGEVVQIGAAVLPPPYFEPVF